MILDGQTLPTRQSTCPSPDDRIDLSNCLMPVMKNALRDDHETRYLQEGG